MASSSSWVYDSPAPHEVPLEEVDGSENASMHQHQAQCTISQDSNGETEAAKAFSARATKNKQKRSRTMSVERLQRKVNEQLVNDMWSESHSQRSRASHTNRDLVGKEAPKPKSQRRCWPFQLPRLPRVWNRNPRTFSMP